MKFKSFQGIVGLWTLSAILLPGANVRAILPPTQTPLPNFDRRIEGRTNETPSDAVRAAERRLKTELPRARVSFDPVSRAPRYISTGGEFLTAAGGRGKTVSAGTAARFAVGDPYGPTKAFVQEHRDLFGHGPEALDQARIKREFETAHNGLKTVVWEQQVDGIPVFEAIFISHTTRNGELVNVASQFVPDPVAAADSGAANRAAVQAAPNISARQAAVLAAKNIEVELDEDAVVSEPGGDAAGAEKKQLFRSAKLNGNTEAKLTWLPMGQNQLRLCWNVILTSRERGEVFRILVDAQTGEVQVRHCMTAYLSNATYRVYASDSPAPFTPSDPTPTTNQPPVVSRSLVTLSALDTNASPEGWIPDGGNETLGNNVDAHTDWDRNNSPDLPRPQGSPSRVFDFPIDLTQAPSTYANAAVVQLFYWNNFMHDKLYQLGFTEAAGNFQSNNFGRGGLGNDAVKADAQDGSGFNNANFSTLPDGDEARMQMYFFNGPTPDRDGDLDAEIILHEYTHGLSNRRVGGGLGISAWQTAGMGEGWSDFYALCLLSEAGDDVNGVYSEGGYATYLYNGLTTNYYFGIRRYPYCTDMTKNPLTFKDIDPAQASTHAGVPRNPVIPTTADDVHNIGEVWCVTLREAWANLVTKHGWATGNQLILQLVTDGMNLSPVNPTFLEARDAILQADQVDNGGANQNELWAAFAKRGMGYSATSPGSGTPAGVQEAFDVADYLTILPTGGVTADGQLGGPFSPTVMTFSLTNVGSTSLNWSLANTSAWLSVFPTSGTLAPGDVATDVTVTVLPLANVLPGGSQVATITITNKTSGVVQLQTVTLNVVGLGMADDFDPGIDLSQWSAFGGKLGDTVRATNYGGYVSSPSSLWFADNADRYATTVAINTTGGGTISFWLSFGTGRHGRESFPWEFCELPIQGIALEASTNSGTSWSMLGLYNTTNFYTWTAVALSIPASARSSATLFRWRQVTHFNSNLGLDNWALDNVVISAIPTTTLTLITPASVSEGDAPWGGIVTAWPVPTNDLTVTLYSPDTSELTVPPTVTILAGQSNAVFTLTVLDDADLDGSQTVQMIASAPGYFSVSRSITVLDDEFATLALTVPGSVAEGAGPYVGWADASAAPAANITVALNASAPADILVPATVVIPAGQTSAVFFITVVDDNRVDRTQNVTLTADVPNWSGANALISVVDNEPTNLTVTLPAVVSEDAGVLTGAGSVRISGTLTNGLLVSLVSSIPGRLAVPSTVTIPGGQLSNTFNITLLDNDLQDGNQSASVTASTPGFSNGTNSLLMVDDDLAPTLLAQPWSQSTFVSYAVVFVAAASGKTPLSYQWQFNTTNISGATNATLTLTNTQSSQAGNYVVVVTNRWGSATSSNAVLTVMPVVCATPASGLVSWWQGEGDATDLLGTNAGVLEGGTGFVPGKVSSAFSFDGVDDRVRVPASAGLNLGTQPGFTLEAWINPFSTAYGHPILEWNNASASFTGLNFWVGHPSLPDAYLGADLFDGNTDHVLQTASGTIASNTMQHVALTYDKASGIARLFINGVMQTQASFGTVTVRTTGDLYIGARLGSVQPRFFQGIIDEPSIYNRALTTNEINAIYVASSFGKCFTPTLPSLTTQPASLTSFVGTLASFSVTAAGTRPLGYQWLFNGTNISNATNTTLTLTNVQIGQSGSYTVVVTNSWGAAASSNAVLTVTPIDCALSNMVTWWRGEGDASDSVGASGGTLVGSAVFNTGEVGQGFSFNGISGYVSVPNSPLLNSLRSRLTVEFWFRCNSTITNSDWRGILCKGGTAWRVMATAYAKTVTFSADGTSGGNLIGTKIVSDGQWHHMAGVYDGTNMYLYVDGSLDVSKPATGLIGTNTSPLAIGAMSVPPNALYFFNGSVDEVSLYSRALTSNEIAGVYSAGTLGKCYTPSPPNITQQPVGQAVLGGANVTFSVSASGTAPMSYFWQKNDVNIGGLGGASLSLTNVTRTNSGTYRVVVTNALGSATSSNAVLLVRVPQRLGTPIRLADGTFTCLSSDADGGILSAGDLSRFEAQASTNLVDWTTLPGALTITNGGLRFYDATTNAPMGFYRIIEH